ncbi:hypothetical protein [Bradyrhizobium sp. WYCCWR 12699]|uniref:hypothetical protein n=1 Tax=Bradyrhizobium sp. WYCCWR 12699 TaxID=3064203 RepID=UPI0028A3539D|nr:hypothetical protein [Bradyrhizobium sp. WYCCWR 12699]MDT4739928.1 hypothetical protein [Bradyrhizobium sp. WYCCWR 12699]
MARAKQDQIVLERTNELSYSSEGPVVVSHRKRGFLRDIEVVDASDKLHKPIFRPNGRLALTAHAERARAHLDKKDLPTDKWSITPRELDFGYVVEEHGEVADEDLWFGLAEAYTEPLTEDRLAAEFLHAANRVLTRFNDDELDDIFRLAYVHHLYSTAGKLNELALDGERSRGNLAKGSQVKKKVGAAQRKLILGIAQEFWLKHPNLEGQYFNTAKKIQDLVNDARANQSLGSEPLAPRTISNQLRMAVQELADQT